MLIFGVFWNVLYRSAKFHIEFPVLPQVENP